MGDFSIRCAISGVPIPCNTPVLVFRLGKSDRHPKYHYLASMPVEGTMGSYGQADDIDDFYIDGFTYAHVLPNLWKAAGEIWTAAMFNTGRKGVPSLIDEIEHHRRDHAHRVKEYEQFKGTAAYTSLLEPRLDGSHSEWLRRAKDLVLFAPDFGGPGEIMCFIKDLITKGDDIDRDGCEKLLDLIAGCMSTCITGTSMLNKDQTHPFEQYPDLKVDLLWHEAIVTEIKRLRKDA